MTDERITIKVGTPSPPQGTHLPGFCRLLPHLIGTGARPPYCDRCATRGEVPR